jgi:hypothetical protein
LLSDFKRFRYSQKATLAPLNTCLHETFSLAKESCSASRSAKAGKNDENNFLPLTLSLSRQGRGRYSVHFLNVKRKFPDLKRRNLED